MGITVLKLDRVFTLSRNTVSFQDAWRVDRDPRRLQHDTRC